METSSLPFEAYKVEFDYTEVFIVGCRLSQFITLVTQIHGNLMLCMNYIRLTRDAASKIHPDSEMYFLGNLLSHTREAVKTMGEWLKEDEVKSFMQRHNLLEEMNRLTTIQDSFIRSSPGEFLLAVRDSIFHYNRPKPQYTSKIDEVMTGISENLKETYITVSENYKVQVADYGKHILSGLISIGHDTPDQFQVKIDSCQPYMLDIIQLCSEAIVYFIWERSPEFNQIKLNRTIDQAGR